ncbi:MAG: hypothetical protein WCP95_02665 [Actinomycetes bacterium]
MTMLKVSIALTAACVVIAGAVPAHAGTVSATDGGSQASLKTPITAPPEGKCTQLPYAFTLDKDVDYATTVILDANSAMVARGEELPAGTGTGRLSVCGATIHGKSSPFTLQLMITYTENSAKGAVTAVSMPFTFTSKPITCKKTSNPGKGHVKKYSTGACPKGWKFSPKRAPGRNDLVPA